MFVVDTNTLIYFFKDRGRVRENLRAVAPGEICIPTVVLYELHVGLVKSVSPQKRTQKLEQLLRTSHIVIFDTKAAIASALVRAKLEQQGTPIEPIDILVAGTAISLGATVVTHNTREFARVEGLDFVDWF